MKIEIDLDDLPVSGKAEVLRGLVFKQYGEHGEYQRGCYATFDVNPGFVEIDPHKYEELLRMIEPVEDIPVSAYESDKIVAMWWWDGDGTLLIWIKGEPNVYLSFDCKTDSDWIEEKVYL